MDAGFLACRCGVSKAARACEAPERGAGRAEGVAYTASICLRRRRQGKGLIPIPGQSCWNWNEKSAIAGGRNRRFRRRQGGCHPPYPSINPPPRRHPRCCQQRACFFAATRLCSTNFVSHLCVGCPAQGHPFLLLRVFTKILACSFPV